MLSIKEETNAETHKMIIIAIPSWWRKKKETKRQTSLNLSNAYLLINVFEKEGKKNSCDQNKQKFVFRCKKKKIVMRFHPKYTTCAKGLYYHIPLPSFLYVWPFNSQDLISNSPYCLPNDSHYVSLENLVSDQLVIPQLTFLFILITCLNDVV